MRLPLILICAALCAGAASAAELAGGPAPASAPAGPIKAGLNQAVRVTLSRDIKSVALGSGEIADVNVVSGRLLVITGKKPGLTNLLVFDNADRVLLDRQISVTAEQPEAMTVYEGGSAKSYVCTPLCSAVDPAAASAPGPAAAPPAASLPTP